MTDEIKKHVISVLVDNESGSLARIVGLFSGRGYNIESLNVAPINKEKTLSRVNIITFGSDKTVDLICKLLGRIVPVHKAAELSKQKGYIERELVLLKIVGDEKKKQKAMKIADKYRTNIIDIAEDSIVFELIGSSKIVDEIIEKLSEIGIHSMSRTGVVAGFRGNKTIMTED
ncbi:MAG: acetolactate synthase-1/3 small subunit [Rickettsiales bacterium]|jgi:acetolactate synthase-1/3 small subunit